jgi:shikimate kinase
MSPTSGRAEAALALARLGPIVYPATMTVDPALRRKTIALVGLMGVGKSSVGRRLAHALAMPFCDVDDEIEKAAGCSIPEIFAKHGEAEFREGERRVIARMLDDPPHVMATGGGAFCQPATQALIQSKSITVWLQADVDVLVRRVGRRDNRPLLKGKDARAVLARLAKEREPFYAQADIHISSGEAPHQAAVDAIITGLKAHYARSDPPGPQKDT